MATLKLSKADFLYIECSKCFEIKHYSEYYKKRTTCKKCCQLHCKNYKKNHKINVSEYNKNYKKEHKSEISVYNKNYNIVNRKQIQIRQTKYLSNLRKTSPSYKFSTVMRTKMGKLMRGDIKKSARTTELLGCTFDKFKKWIEFQIDTYNTKNDIDINNHGSVWDLDHVIPCANFTFETKREQKICFNWSNYQPLKKKENNIKGSNISWWIMFNHEIKIKYFMKNETGYVREFDDIY